MARREANQSDWLPQAHHRHRAHSRRSLREHDGSPCQRCQPRLPRRLRIRKFRSRSSRAESDGRLGRCSGGMVREVRAQGQLHLRPLRGTPRHDRDRLPRQEPAGEDAHHSRKGQSEAIPCRRLHTPQAGYVRSAAATARPIRRTSTMLKRPEAVQPFSRVHSAHTLDPGIRLDMGRSVRTIVGKSTGGGPNNRCME